MHRMQGGRCQGAQCPLDGCRLTHSCSAQVHGWQGAPGHSSGHSGSARHFQCAPSLPASHHTHALRSERTKSKELEENGVSNKRSADDEVWLMSWNGC
jgi:hypothetical protein